MRHFWSCFWKCLALPFSLLSAFLEAGEDLSDVARIRARSYRNKAIEEALNGTPSNVLEDVSFVDQVLPKQNLIN